MESYIRASGFVLYPYVFVAGPNKYDTFDPGILALAETSTLTNTARAMLYLPKFLWARC